MHHRRSTHLPPLAMPSRRQPAEAKNSKLRRMSARTRAHGRATLTRGAGASSEKWHEHARAGCTDAAKAEPRSTGGQGLAQGLCR